MIFTAGAVTNYDKAVGFRVYDRFQGNHASHGQVVVVFDSDTGDFKGVIVGSHLGAMRTGAIGAVAIKHMARPDARRAAILGSGQARTHLAAAAVTLFCTAGLSGTEVAVASEALRRAGDIEASIDQQRSH